MFELAFGTAVSISMIDKEVVENVRTAIVGETLGLPRGSHNGAPSGA
jgi:hypothetical protein